MIVNSVTVENYRSIKKSTLLFNEISGKKSFILLGINEAGKSNVLKAISLLSKTETLNYDIDCNKDAIDDGKQISITYDLDIGNVSFYKSQFTKKIDKDLVALISVDNIQRKIIFEKDNSRSDFFYIYLEDNDLFSNYIIDETKLIIKKSTDIFLGPESLTKENISLLLGDSFKIVDCRNLESFIEDQFFSLFEVNTPKIIFWKSEDKYLINDAIDLNSFKEDPTISIPLRNIFSISGIEDIKYRIELISKSDEKRQELEEILSETITSHINKVWKDHKIKINIRIEESLNCKINVEDKDNRRPKFKMEQRSDGFKQFVSILLNLSAENEAALLKNKIILLDEPETHLHPSGIKYLKDELFRISENNTVLIATHSIYMVDKKNLDCHYSVEKEKGITIITQIEKTNPYKDEVLYEALGTSVYEHIEPNMLIFEGKTDRDLFDAFTNKFKTELKPKNIGTMSADGAENIQKYTKFFNKKLVNGYVLVDSDKDGIKAKNNALKDDNFSLKNTFEINDIINTEKKATLEDLFDNELILKNVKNRYDVDIEVDNAQPIIEQIKYKLTGKGKIGKNDTLHDLKADLCNSILQDISKLTKANAKKKYEQYFIFCSKLHEKIK